MAGTFSGLPLVQQFDQNGDPLNGCLLYVFSGGTSQPAAVYQDLQLTINAQWPLRADASGRIPLFFVADGFYRVRLTDSNGVQQFDLPQVPSIGPSSTGGSGGSVDATTIFSTGDIKFRASSEQLGGWVRLNGRTIGSATSGSSEFANSGAQALFQYLWDTFSNSICPVIGGRGASSLADWNANKQITLLDFRFRTPIGVDDMGNSAAGRAANALFANGNSTTAGSYGGEAAHLLTTAEIPLHSHSIPALTGSTSTAGAHTHGGVTGAGGAHSHTTDVQGSHSHSGTTNTAGAHTHGGATSNEGSHNHAGSTIGTNGAHTHGGATGSTSPDHTHTVAEVTLNSSGTAFSVASGVDGIVYRTIAFGTTTATTSGASGGIAHTHAIASDGNHNHSLTITLDGTHNHVVTTDSQGDHTHTFTTGVVSGHSHTTDTSPTHTHTIASDGNHSHTVTTSTSTTGNTGAGGVHNNMQPFVTGTFYMKL